MKRTFIYLSRFASSLVYAHEVIRYTRNVIIKKTQSRRIKIISDLFLILYANFYQAKSQFTLLTDWLIPKPQEITIGNDLWSYRPGRIICPGINDPEIFLVIKSVQSVFEKQGHSYSFAAVEAKSEVPVIRMEIDDKTASKSQVTTYY